MTASRWTADQISTIDPMRTPYAPLIAQAMPLLTDVDLWDYWPVQTTDGTQADIAGGTLFIILSAPRQIDPDARHGYARLRLMHRRGGNGATFLASFPMLFAG